MHVDDLATLDNPQVLDPSKIEADITAQGRSARIILDVGDVSRQAFGVTSAQHPFHEIKIIPGAEPGMKHAPDADKAERVTITCPTRRTGLTRVMLGGNKCILPVQLAGIAGSATISVMICHDVHDEAWVLQAMQILRARLWVGMHNTFSTWVESTHTTDQQGRFTRAMVDAMDALSKIVPRSWAVAIDALMHACRGDSARFRAISFQEWVAAWLASPVAPPLQGSTSLLFHVALDVVFKILDTASFEWWMRAAPVAATRVVYDNIIEDNRSFGKRADDQFLSITSLLLVAGKTNLELPTPREAVIRSLADIAVRAAAIACDARDADAISTARVRIQDLEHHFAWISQIRVEFATTCHAILGLADAASEETKQVALAHVHVISDTLEHPSPWISVPFPVSDGADLDDIISTAAKLPDVMRDARQARAIASKRTATGGRKID